MISGVDSLMPLTHLAHPSSHNPSGNPLFSIFNSLLCFVPLPIFILFLLPFPYVHLFCVLKSSYEGRWMAQLVERMTSAQVMISWFVSSSPASGSVLTAQSLEPALDSVSPCPSPTPPLVLSVSQK